MQRSLGRPPVPGARPCATAGPHGCDLPPLQAWPRSLSTLPFLGWDLQPPTCSLSTVFSIEELEQLSHSSAPRQGDGGRRKAQDVAPTCQSRERPAWGIRAPCQPALGQQGAHLPCFHTQVPRRASMTQALRTGSCAPAPSGPQASGLVSQSACWGRGAGGASDRGTPRHSPPGHRVWGI